MISINHLVSQSLTALASLLILTTTVSAHDGRRLEVLVIDNQLFTQGYNSTGADDGAGAVRPYYNTIHGHWNNITETAAIADLPGFDVFGDYSDASNSPVGKTGSGAASLLDGESLTLTLNGASIWTTGAMMPYTFSPVALDHDGLNGDDDPIITISSGIGPAINTQTLGSITLIDPVNAAGSLDLDLSYSIPANPSGEIYLLEWTLSTSAAGIADSLPIYTILAPDPDPLNTGSPNGMLGLHHAALHAESQVGVVPEPTTGLLALAGLGTLLLSRRRRV